MSTLKFDFEWRDIPGTAEPAIAATMADLLIQAGDECATQVFDKPSKSVRNVITTPLYPIAEWIASRWWNIFDECDGPSRSGDYADRHLLRTAERGFVLPNLWFRSDGEVVQIEWEPRRTTFARIDFLSTGNIRVDPTFVRQQLRDFVDAVISRLRDSDVQETWLQQEWAAIELMHPDEEEFCRSAGRLGLDPYDLEDDLADAIKLGAERLSPQLWSDCQFAIPPARLREAINWIEENKRKLEGKATTQVRLPERLQSLKLHPVDGLPWSRGYQIARQLRHALSLADDEIIDPSVLFQVSPTIVPDMKGLYLDGLERVEKGFAPQLATSKTRPDSQRFMMARAMMHCVLDQSETYHLLTPAMTAQQQQGRAFAAELLAPARFLQNRICSATIDHDQVDDLSEELRVSSYVIEHQVRNHRLARIIA